MEALLVQKFRRKISEGSVELLFARDGVEALDLLASGGSMDMVITDINMPRMDGLTLLQKLQETEEELKKLDEAIRILGYKDRADWYRDMKRKAIAESKRKEATPCKTD
jgi:adenylate cyclase